MKKFGWLEWFLAMLIILVAASGISFLLGKIMYPKTFDIYQAVFSGLAMTLLVFWIVANKKPKIGGTLRIDTTRDNKDIWRFEVEDLSQFKDKEYVMIQISRKKVLMSSEDFLSM